MSENRVVVCGGNGYVGRRLVNFLGQKGFEVLAVGRRFPACPNRPNVYIAEGDLLDPAFCRGVVRGAKWVYNLAANVGGIGFIGGHKADCLSSAAINLNLLNAAKKENLAGYFFASSSCVYPGLKEGFRLPETITLDPLPGYGEEKVFSERVCRAFHEDYGIPVRIARYHTIYGPGDNRPGREHVTEALCKKVIRAKLYNTPDIAVWGNGTQTRSFLYIDDCVEGTFRLMHSQCASPMNLAHAQSASVEQVIQSLEEIAAIKLERFYNLNGPIGCQHKVADISACREVLKWEPQVDLKTGLARMYRDYYDAALAEF
jgi:GDP-D-mannose 3',5'-epimerase